MEKENLSKMVGQNDHLIYQAVKEGGIDRLSGESRSYAEAIQEHLHLSHIRNALEFADVRDGQPYEIESQGEPMNPLAHVALHAAVKESIKQHPPTQAAFTKLLEDGANKHQAEHILGMLFAEAMWKAAGGDDTHKVQKVIEKIRDKKKFRRVWINKTTAAHPWAGEGL